MTLLLLIAAGVAFWAWQTNRLPQFQIQDIGAVAAAIAGVKLLAQGQWLLGAIALGGAIYWFERRRKNWSASLMPIDEARRLLEVPPGADAETIKAAHRRLIARVHPDSGGSAELSARVNAARDALLAELRRRR
jgi:hypothetical protein